MIVESGIADADPSSGRFQERISRTIEVEGHDCVSPTLTIGIHHSTPRSHEPYLQKTLLARDP